MPHEIAWRPVTPEGYAVGCAVRFARKAFIVAAAIGALESCAEAGTTTLGTLHLPTVAQAKFPGARKLLIVRGHLLTGVVPVTVVNGRLWFGRVCADCDVQPFHPVSAKEARHIDPGGLSPQALAMLSDNPWVRKRIYHGEARATSGRRLPGGPG
jgi:hypothetical protein